jgi:hypothetical protein
MDLIQRCGYTSSALFASLCFVPLAQAEDSAELAKQALNPVAAMYSLPVQYNWDQKMGPTGEGMHSVTNIQPVLPFTLNDDWNLISRTILPVIDQHGLAPDGAADKSGVGDITQSFFFSPKKPTDSGWILGVGPAILIPTGSDELLGSEQWGIGPTAVALKQANGWTHGILANHIWGLEGSPPDNKEKVNQTFLQPFLSYTTSTFTTYGGEHRIHLQLAVTRMVRAGQSDGHTTVENRRAATDGTSRATLLARQPG